MATLLQDNGVIQCAQDAHLHEPCQTTAAAACTVIMRCCVWQPRHVGDHYVGQQPRVQRLHICVQQLRVVFAEQHAQHKLRLCQLPWRWHALQHEFKEQGCSTARCMLC